jgi:predicted PurR-regulated permease PerM
LALPQFPPSASKARCEFGSANSRAMVGAMASKRDARRVFIALIVVSLGLVFSIVLPFGAALVFAAVVAATLLPLHYFCTTKFGGRESVSSALLTLGVLLLVLLPVAGLGAFIVSELVRGANFVIETIRSDGMAALVDSLPDSLKGPAHQAMSVLVSDSSSLDAELKRNAGLHGQQVARFVSQTLSATGNAVVQGAMSLIGLFFFLRDGRTFVDWLETNSPLMPGQLRELLHEFRKVTTAVLVSTVVTAGVQASVALLGYLLARVPHPFFFSIVTFFIAFIPAVGAGGACLVAALLMLATGQTWAALLLALWVAPVGLVDNLVKPILVKRGMHMHGGIIFFALLGGIAAFGAIGLLLGPLFVTFLVALARIYRRDFSGAPKAA